MDITDRNTQTAKLNLERNLEHSSHHCAAVVPYEWGQPLRAPLSPPYDLVLGSDVVYIEDTYHLLVQSLEWLCTSAADTVVLLASKLRYRKVQDFMKLIETKFEYHVIHESDNNNIRIYWVTLKT